MSETVLSELSLENLNEKIEQTLVYWKKSLNKEDRRTAAEDLSFLLKAAERKNYMVDIGIKTENLPEELTPFVVFKDEESFTLVSQIPGSSENLTIESFPLLHDLHGLEEGKADKIGLKIGGPEYQYFDPEQITLTIKASQTPNR